MDEVNLSLQGLGISVGVREEPESREGHRPRKNEREGAGFMCVVGGSAGCR